MCKKSREFGKLGLEIWTLTLIGVCELLILLNLGMALWAPNLANSGGGYSSVDTQGPNATLNFITVRDGYTKKEATVRSSNIHKISRGSLDFDPRKLQTIERATLARITKLVMLADVRQGGARLLVVVESAYGNLAARKFIRETWGSPEVQARLGLQVLFLVGRPARRGDPGVVVNEAQRHQDLLQADFEDTYRNLTFKTLALMAYVRDQVDPALVDMVLKVDDDVLVDPFALVKLLEKEKQGDGGWGQKFLCSVNSHAPPFRKKASKWFVSYSKWPRSFTYPPYCDGPAYLFPPSVAAAVLRPMEDGAEDSTKVPFLWLEDVFVTGVLARMSGTGHRPTLNLGKLAKGALTMPSRGVLMHPRRALSAAQKRRAWETVKRRSAKH